MPRTWGYGTTAGYTPRRRTRRPATQETVAAWAAASVDNARALDYLVAQEAANNLNSFTGDILRKLRLFGSLSERQVAAVLNSRTRDEAWAAQREAEQKALRDVAGVAEGRRTITGEVTSAKWKTGRYGTQPKMLVREDDGNKVWGTIPANLVPEVEWDALHSADQLRPLVGQRVTLVATVKASDDDAHFGFYSRPTEACLILPPAPTQRLARPEIEPVCTRGWESTDGECSHCEDLLARGMSLVEDEG